MAPRDQPDPNLIVQGSRERRATERVRDMASTTSPATPTSPKKRPSANKPNSVIVLDSSDAENGNVGSKGQKRSANVDSGSTTSPTKRRASTSTAASPKKRARTNKPSSAIEVDDSGPEDGNVASKGKKRAAASTSNSPQKRPRMDSEDANGPSTSRDRSSGDPTALDDEGFLADIDVTDLTSAKKAKTDANKDINYFFGPIYTIKRPNNTVQARRICAKCPGGKKSITAHSTTLRRHLESDHYNTYHKWAKKVEFISALPGDRAKAKKATEGPTTQPTIDPHLKEIPVKEVIIPYSDELFREAAIEWLVATDQPVDALDDPRFRNMIDIASRAKNGVRISGQKATRQGIINMFQKRMDNLKKKLNGPTVIGEIHLTDDAWQAQNTDGYFGVTGHWIEEVSPGVWESQEALIGFTRLNSAHNGVRLGQALYKIVSRLGIQKRVGYLTTDSAANNSTAAVEFAAQLLQRDGVVWDPEERHLPCMAHIINLATQTLISTYSKSPHFDPKDPESHVPDTDMSIPLRDEIGLVRTIAVKDGLQERSSSKRKQIFKDLQMQTRTQGDNAEVRVTVGKQLILDMKVRWSSTYHMLLRAYELREHVNTFVNDISYDAATSEERSKIRELKLTLDEWARVHKFTGFLAASFSILAEKAQQAFSSGTVPSLHNAIPALEALHSAWTKRAGKPDNANYAPALEKAAAKIDQYYQRTARSTAQVMAMVLDPSQKGRYFEKYWGSELAKEARATAEKIFAERWRKLHSNGTASNPVLRRPSKLCTLLRELTPDSDDEALSSLSEHHRDPTRPWLDEFEEYYNSRPEIVPENVSMVSWWGACVGRLPTWRSLARDRLSIPASSVSSERAFSAGGITISKRRNRLKGDIVEALQILKSLFKAKDMFRTALAPAEEFEEVDEVENNTGSAAGWDCFLDDNPDNYEPDTSVD
ncbi:putative AC transposase [Mycena venus]|uniref:Putative AC transposase n=1 Tax=Mycena venus TaxID=2733690 RepID=A0A8H6XM62_9AGAR|nr:putative AC transposase [Mycena venus]